MQSLIMQFSPFSCYFRRRGFKLTTPFNAAPRPKTHGAVLPLGFIHRARDNYAFTNYHFTLLISTSPYSLLNYSFSLISYHFFLSASLSTRCSFNCMVWALQTRIKGQIDTEFETKVMLPDVILRTCSPVQYE